MEKAVQIEGFHEAVRALAPSAVYLLVREGRVVYVGKSTNVYCRISGYYQDRQRLAKGLESRSGHKVIPFDRVFVKFVPVHRLDAEEVELIQRFQPEHNVRLNRPKFDPTMFPSLMAFVRAAKEREAQGLRRRRL